MINKIQTNSKSINFTVRKATNSKPVLGHADVTYPPSLSQLRKELAEYPDIIKHLDNGWEYLGKWKFSEGMAEIIKAQLKCLKLDQIKRSSVLPLFEKMNKGLTEALKWLSNL